MTTLIPVVFRFPPALAPAARNVAVLGSFNRWAPAAHRLTMTADGGWTITIYLPPGRILYHFAVDGVFWLDPFDEERLPNGWGSEYSVRYVRDGGQPPLELRKAG
jgi:hypothetical protein